MCEHSALSSELCRQCDNHDASSAKQILQNFRTRTPILQICTPCWKFPDSVYISAGQMAPCSHEPRLVPLAIVRANSGYQSRPTSQAVYAASLTWCLIGNGSVKTMTPMNLGYQIGVMTMLFGKMKWFMFVRTYRQRFRPRIYGWKSR